VLTSEQKSMVLSIIEEFATYGIAVDRIYKRKDDNWGMDNGEYESHPIFYCPCCGVKLE
jgi:hypothetical protein